WVSGFGCRIGNDRGGSPLDRGRDKLSTVSTAATDRDEDGAFVHGTRVGGDGRYLDVKGTRVDGLRKRGDEFAESHGWVLPAILSSTGSVGVRFRWAAVRAAMRAKQGAAMVPPPCLIFVKG